MIWLRRFIAFPFIVIFVVTFFATLFTFNFNLTIANPDFYTEQLEENNAYEYFHESFMPAIVGVAFKQERIEEKALEKIFLTLIKDTFPATWLQKIAEECIHSSMPFVLGKTDQFTVDISLLDRIDALEKTINHNFLESQNPSIYDELIKVVSKGIVENFKGKEIYNVLAPNLPESKEATIQELEELLRKVYSLQTCQELARSYLKNIFAYLRDEAETFSLEVDLSNIFIVVAEWSQKQLAKPNIYQHLLKKEIIPYFVNRITTNGLPFGITFSNEELEVLNEVFPHDWFILHSKEYFNNAISYVKKDVENFYMEIDLSTQRENFASTFTKLFHEKLKQEWNSLEEGKPEDTEEILSTLKRGLLSSHRASGMSYSQMLQAIDMDVDNLLYDYLMVEIPNNIEVTHQEMVINHTIQDNFSFLEDFREKKTFNHNFHQLVEFRRTIQKGISFDESAFSSSRDFNELRNFFAALVATITILLAITLVILVVVVFLCVDTGGSKLVFAAITILFSALLALGITQAYQVGAFPVLMQEIQKDIQRENDPAKKIGLELAENMLTGGNDAMVNSLKTMIYVIIFLCFAMIFISPFLKSLRSSQEQFDIDKYDPSQQQI